MCARIGMLTLGLLLLTAALASAEDADGPASQATSAPSGESERAPIDAPVAPPPTTAERAPVLPDVQDLDAPRAEPTSREAHETRLVLTEYLRADDALSAIEAERRKHRLVAPLTLAIVGSAVGAVFGAMTAVQGVDVRDLEAELEDEYDYEADAIQEELTDARRVKRAFLGVSLVGVSVGIGSAVWFARRLLVRRPLDASAVELRSRREALKLQLKLQLSGSDFAANVVAPF